MAKAAFIEVSGRIALLKTQSFDIKIIGERHSINMKIEDKGGYEKVIAERLVLSLITLMQDLSDV